MSSPTPESTESNTPPVAASTIDVGKPQTGLVIRQTPLRWIRRFFHGVVHLVDVVLTLTIFLVLSVIILLLVQAGSSTLAIAVGIVGSATTLAVPVLNWYRAQSEKTLTESKTNVYIGLIYRLLLLIAAIVGGSTLLNSIGKELYDQGLRETAIIDVQRDLNEASFLGYPVVAELETSLAEQLNQAPSVQQDKDRAVIWAQVYTDFANNQKQRDDFAKALASDTLAKTSLSVSKVTNYTSVCENIKELSLSQAENGLAAIAIISPYVAGEITVDAANAGIDLTLYNSQNPAKQGLCTDLLTPFDTADAIGYLTFARTAEGRVGSGGGLSTELRSAIHDYYAYTQMLYAPTRTMLPDAITEFWAALALDPTNYLARYDLAELLLQTADQQPDRVAALRDAANVAHAGWNKNLNDITGSSCNPPQTAPADFDHFKPLKYCFLLLTTEVGARYALQDDPDTLLTWVNHAIDLAESKPFTDYLKANPSRSFYLGEAYYYWARLESDQAVPSMVCNIRVNFDVTDLQQRSWVAWADNWLNQHHVTACSPSS